MADEIKNDVNVSPGSINSVMDGSPKIEDVEQQMKVDHPQDAPASNSPQGDMTYLESKAEFPEFNDITRLIRIVCEFETDDNIHKTLEFPEIFIGIVVEVLGFVVHNGVLYMDSDEELCSPEKCDIPPIARVEGYKWMKLHLVFAKPDGEEIGCELNLTPVQMTCLIILLRFKRTPGTDMFSCVTEQRAELYYRNIEKYGELIREGKI